VIAQDGHIYEKEAIERWFSSSQRSPVTNKIISNVVTPVFAVRKLVADIVKQREAEQKQVEARMKMKARMEAMKEQSQVNKRQCIDRRTLPFIFNSMRHFLDAEKGVKLLLSNKRLNEHFGVQLILITRYPPSGKINDAFEQECMWLNLKELEGKVYKSANRAGQAMMTVARRKSSLINMRANIQIEGRLCFWRDEEIPETVIVNSTDEMN
jgi:hypothetical protein